MWFGVRLLWFGRRVVLACIQFGWLCVGQCEVLVVSGVYVCYVECGCWECVVYVVWGLGCCM